MINRSVWEALTAEFSKKDITLVAVSKKKPVSDIVGLYDLGQRDFGENYVQELLEKQPLLPPDVKWHFIGHLQTNKVKYIAPFIHLIHAVDSISLLSEISRQALKNNRVIDVLLQVYIANEETKFGMDENEVMELLHSVETGRELFRSVRICGLMGMATNATDEQVVKNEFAVLRTLFNKLRTTVFAERSEFRICSMGMSADYQLAVSEGSTMVRIGSLLFGER